MSVSSLTPISTTFMGHYHRCLPATWNWVDQQTRPLLCGCQWQRLANSGATRESALLDEKSRNCIVGSNYKWREVQGWIFVSGCIFGLLHVQPILAIPRARNIYRCVCVTAITYIHRSSLSCVWTLYVKPKCDFICQLTRLHTVLATKLVQRT